MVGLRQFRLCCGCLGFVLVMMGCATTEIFGLEEQELTEVRLRPGATFSLYVELGGKSEVEAGNLRVQQNGDVVLPVVGTVTLAGLTPKEASEHLGQSYRAYYIQEPLVRVQFSADKSGVSSPWGYVTVLGRVANPGPVGLPPTRDLTVSGAIQGAGGFDTSANLNAVRITRLRKDGRTSRMVINMNKIGEGGDVHKDIRLQVGDVVYIPERIF